METHWINKLHSYCQPASTQCDVDTRALWRHTGSTSYIAIANLPQPSAMLIKSSVETHWINKLHSYCQPASTQCDVDTRALWRHTGSTSYIAIVQPAPTQCDVDTRALWRHTGSTSYIAIVNLPQPSAMLIQELCGDTLDQQAT